MVSVIVTTAPRSTTPPAFPPIERTPVWPPGEGQVLRGGVSFELVMRLTGAANGSLFLLSRCSNQSEAADGPYWAYNYCPTSYSWLVLLGLLLYLAFFAPGMEIKALLSVCSFACFLLVIFTHVCLRVRDGHRAVDRELGDLPDVGPQHR